MQIRVKTPTDGGEAELLTKFYCDYKKYYIYLRKTNLNIGAHEHSTLHNCSFAAVRLHYITVGCGCALRLDNDSKTNGFRIIKKQIYHVPKNKYYQYEGSKTSN